MTSIARNSIERGRVRPGETLLHIGLPKTGTTAVQHALSDARPVLERRRVRYPGTERSHRSAAAAMLGLQPLHWPPDPTVTTDRSAWEAIVDEVHRAPADWRCVVSAESLSAADDAQAARAVDDLGPMHVVVGVRSLADQLVSNWQQRLRVGLDVSIDEWLARLLEPASGVATARSERVLGLESSDIVARWAALVGPDRVTVVVVDGEDRTELDLFESLLDLEPGDLRLSFDPVARNRSFTWEEASILLRVNASIDRTALSYADYERMMDLVTETLHRRGDGAGDRIPLPSWARPRICEIARCNADAIAALGVEVVGRLDSMVPAGRSESDEVHPGGPEHEARVEAGAELLLASFGSGRIEESDLDRVMARSSARRPPR